MAYKVIGIGKAINGLTIVETESAAEALTHLRAANKQFGGAMALRDGTKVGEGALARFAREERFNA